MLISVSARTCKVYCVALVQGIRLSKRRWLQWRPNKLQQVGITDIVRDKDERKEKGEMQDAGTELWSRNDNIWQFTHQFPCNNTNNLCVTSQTRGCG